MSIKGRFGLDKQAQQDKEPNWCFRIEIEQQRLGNVDIAPSFAHRYKRSYLLSLAESITI